MSSASRPWHPQGVILFSQDGVSYELLRELETSHHGESTVLARQRTGRSIGGQVVIKRLPLTDVDAATRDLIRTRLQEEVRLATYLQHPNIARVHRSHETPDDFFVVRDFVEGWSLNTLLTASMMCGVHLSEAFVLHVGVEVARALHHAHTRVDEQGHPLQILHRDLNPRGITLGPLGEVTLTDFGLAHSRLPGRRPTTLPRPRGNVYFAAPEALLGGNLDARSDLFSLGLVLLELATWNHLYNLDASAWDALPETLTAPIKEQVLGALLTAAAAALPDEVDELILRAATYRPEELERVLQPVSEPLRDILRRLLQREPSARPSTAAELEVELRACLAARGSVYGAAEAAAEVRTSLAAASSSQEHVTATEPGVFPECIPLSADDITTESGRRA
ncbi:serine/threonine-protein kinase [Hyalangium versicolor]|uniref:serine/threonine-protein kinase n=1 Tax=Hyalangium versicolor TaxID=2861190 RepID=UPI001CCE0D07|nr:serine/threonine-protein kinase [Hyalangium versicolor]